jgi:ribosomal protein L32
MNWDHYDEMNDYWVEQTHTITVTQGRKVTARSMAAAERLGKLHWEHYPDEHVCSNCLSYKTRGEIKTTTKRMC